jgi:glycosyltransferase involved in cell wall biosynthesis
MKTLALITSVGPNVNLDWFRMTARSVNTTTSQLEWRIAAPHSVAKEIDKITSEEVDPSIPVYIKVMHTANIAFARNSIIQETHANYIMQFDADDMLIGTGVDILLNKISQENAGWGAAPLCDFDEHTSPVHDPPSKDMLTFENDVIPLNFFPKIRKRTKNMIPMGSVSVHPGACIVRRMYFIKAGGYDMNLGNRWEDYVPFVRINSVMEGTWSSVPVFLYRKNDESITAGDLTDDAIEFYDRYLDEVEEKAENTKLLESDWRFQ